MAEQAMTATPVNAPDILRNMPLTRAIDVELETQILEPVTFNYASANGGRCRFVLPQKGVLNAPDVALVYEVNTQGADYDLAFPTWVGGMSMLQSATLRCGGVIMSQVNNLNKYAAAKTQFKSQAEKTGILDVRHGSSQKFIHRTLPTSLATGQNLVGFQQIYNPELDQVDEFGNAYVAGANEHVIQRSKCLADTAGQGFECSVKLSEIFPILKESRLPLLAMSQVEIEIEFARCGDGTAAANIIECGVIESAVNAGASTCQVTLVRPNLVCDYIHYDDEERQKIYAAINSGAGMALNFTEVLHTRGRNPEGAAGTGAQAPIAAVSSNTIIGMAQKEVKKIYVLKDWDLNTARGINERNSELPYNAAANQRFVLAHRNPVTRQFKSQTMLGEQYNFLINNQKIYNKDVANAAQAHNYLSQCDRKYNVPLLSFDTSNYNANALSQFLDTQMTDGANYLRNNTLGATSRYLSGTQNVIGLNLDTYNELGSTPGNGLRIGSAPIEFNYSCVKVSSNAANTGSSADVILDFFLEYRRSMIIRPLGVTVSDV